jgi:hypothetical protein
MGLAPFNMADCISEMSATEKGNNYEIVYLRTGEGCVVREYLMREHIKR